MYFFWLIANLLAAVVLRLIRVQEVVSCYFSFFPETIRLLIVQ
jgi:hypothetical protein